jgi:hypothetical protein
MKRACILILALASLSALGVRLNAQILTKADFSEQEYYYGVDPANPVTSFSTGEQTLPYTLTLSGSGVTIASERYSDDLDTTLSTSGLITLQPSRLDDWSMIVISLTNIQFADPATSITGIDTLTTNAVIPNPNIAAPDDPSSTASFTSDSATITIVGTGSSNVYDLFNFNFPQPAGPGATSTFQLEIATPEPSTWAMMFGGLALLGFCVRRKLTA